MQTYSKYKYAGISPQKVRLIADVVRGKRVGLAACNLSLVCGSGGPVDQGGVGNPGDKKDDDRRDIFRITDHQGAVRRNEEQVQAQSSQQRGCQPWQPRCWLDRA